MKKCASALLAMVSGLSQAAGTVDFLEVDNDVVLFSTTQAKAAASPNCVTQEKANMWSVSLSSDAGRAVYSMILTSMAKSDSISIDVQSAQDCGVLPGVERASNVSLSQVVDNTPAPSPSLPTDKPFSGTIMDGMMEVIYYRMMDRSKNPSSTASFFNELDNTGGYGGKAKQGYLTSNSRYQMISTTGSGWITAIILPAFHEVGKNVKLEIIIDGQTYTLEGTGQVAGNRFVMGVFDDFFEGYNEYHILKDPQQVVGQGRGIPYKQSFEVYITMDYPADTNSRRWLVNYLPGVPN